jgi:SPP1 gp7 family putative phage head morphogenesis protein
MIVRAGLSVVATSIGSRATARVGIDGGRAGRPVLSLVRAEALPRPDSQGWTLLAKVLDVFRSKEILDSIDFEALSAELKAQAFSIANAWNERFTTALYRSLQEALAGGLSAREWLPEVSQLIKAYGGATNLEIFGPDLSGDSFSAQYADLVFRMATTNAVNGARYSEMFFGPAFEDSPYWLFATAEDERVCPICEPLDGQVFSKSDEAGRHFLPPLHFGSCRCEAIDLSVDDVRAAGYAVTSGASITSPRPDPGFDIDGLYLVPDELRRAA